MYLKYYKDISFLNQHYYLDKIDVCLKKQTTSSLSLELAFFLIKMEVFKRKLNLLESVLEDGACKARIFAVIDTVWAESPGKYFTEVHLVSLLTVGMNGEFWADMS